MQRAILVFDIVNDSKYLITIDFALAEEVMEGLDCVSAEIFLPEDRLNEPYILSDDKEVIDYISKLMMAKKNPDKQPDSEAKTIAILNELRG